MTFLSARTADRHSNRDNMNKTSDRSFSVLDVCSLLCSQELGEEASRYGFVPFDICEDGQMMFDENDVWW